jgi:hypothetical protein
VVSELVGVEGVCSRRGGVGCSGRGRCMVFGPNLGMDVPERTTAPARDGGAGDDIFGVAAVVVMSLVENRPNIPGH